MSFVTLSVVLYFRQMLGERLNVTIIQSSPFGDGSYYQEEFVSVLTLTGQSYYTGDSDEFIDSAGCKECLVKDVFSERGYCGLTRNTDLIPGRKVRYNLHSGSEYFPCQVRCFGI